MRIKIKLSHAYNRCAFCSFIIFLLANVGNFFMCIGLPCQIVRLHEQQPNMAIAQINGIQREVDISLVVNTDTSVSALVGQWVLVHVGFAMSLLDEQEALSTLEALRAMAEESDDVNFLLNPARS